MDIQVTLSLSVYVLIRFLSPSLAGKKALRASKIIRSGQNNGSSRIKTCGRNKWETCARAVLQGLRWVCSSIYRSKRDLSARLKGAGYCNSFTASRFCLQGMHAQAEQEGTNMRMRLHGSQSSTRVAPFTLCCTHHRPKRGAPLLALLLALPRLSRPTRLSQHPQTPPQIPGKRTSKTATQAKTAQM